MLRAIARLVRSDLRHHRFQSALIFLILATATLALTLAVTVERVASEPFDRLMSDTNGAHVWFTAQPGVDLAPIAQSSGVTESTGPFPLAQVNIDPGDTSPFMFPIDFNLLAQPADRQAVGRPLVTEGRWLQSANEIVLDAREAHFMNLKLGDHLSFTSPSGPVDLELVGLAVHMASWVASSGDLTRQAAGYVLPETLARIAPDQSAWQSVLGVRLADPSTSQSFLGDALDRFTADQVVASDWHDFKDEATQDAAVNVTIFRVFSLFALAAAALVIGNAIGGRLIAQFREIGLLKAVGFTPNGVLAIYLVEHLLIGAFAALVGLIAGALLTPVFQNDISEVLVTTPVSPYEPLPLLLVVVIVEGAVALSTLLPALRAARVSVVRAITVGFVRVNRERSRLAWLAAAVRLPVTVVVGLKDAFARPIRAWMTVAALTLTVVMLTFSMGLEATIEDIIDHPERWGQPFDLTFEPLGAAAGEAEGVIAAQPQIQAVVGQLELEARAAGAGQTFTAYALSGDTDLYEPAIPDGRLFAAPGEAVAGQKLIEDLGVKFGDSVELAVNGQPITLRIVGRFIDTDKDGRVILFPLDTYRAAVDPTAQPTRFHIQLRNGASEAAAINALFAAFPESGIETQSLMEDEDVIQIRAILVTLNLVLLVIGTVNLLSTTMLGVRERYRDLGILKALGLTPGQTIGSVLTGVGALALLAALFGIPLGLFVTDRLFDILGRQVGVGTGIGTTPGWLQLALLVPVAVLLALIGGILPARHAANLRVSDALRYE